MTDREARVDDRPTIVVADDDPEHRYLVRIALKGAFEVVAEAGDGQQALSAVAAHDPDLLLLDLSMPVLDGFGVLAELERLGDDRLVVVYSGLPPGNLARRSGKSRPVGFLEKGTSIIALPDELGVLAAMLGAVGGAVAEERSTLAADPTSARVARRFVDDVLRRWDCQAMLDNVSLLVSELVGNSVRHAGSPCEVSVRLLPDSLRVEVRDDDPSLPRRQVADDDSTSGRGIALVEALAVSWGIDLLPRGKCVWFEVPRPDHPSSPSRA